MVDHKPQRYAPTDGPWYYSSGAVWVPANPELGALANIEGACIAQRSSSSAIQPVQRDRNMQLCAAAPRLRDVVKAFTVCGEASEGAHFWEDYNEACGRAAVALALATRDWNDYDKYIAAMREG